MKDTNIKRLFFGIEIFAPWPDTYPKGRLLDPAHRHMTLAFLGNIPYQKIVDILPSFPKPSFKIGMAGIFNECLFLPPRRPHVVAWHVDWGADFQNLVHFQKHLLAWLKEHNFSVDEREFLPHVTIARWPFNPPEWKKSFEKIPCICQNIHLFESVGNLRYEPIWSYPLKAPFEEIEHTADIAFKIRGETINHVYKHAQMALAFRYPEIVPFLKVESRIDSLEDIVIALNEIVTFADKEIRCPYKAVSFHGTIQNEPDDTLLWEMIVDV